VISFEGFAPLDVRRATALLALSAMALVALLIPRPDVHPAPTPTAQPKLPLSFVPNQGQTDGRVRYEVRAPGFASYFTRQGVTIALSKGDRGHALELRFGGANPRPAIEPLARLRGRVNYLTASENLTDMPTYGAVVYRDLWPGIDLVFLGAHGRLKYEFQVAPGADPADIRLAYAGAESFSLTKNGGLAVRTSAGTLRDAAPRSFQKGSGTIATRFDLHGRRGYGFAVGAYDHRRPLTIDPSLGYSTLLGGSISDFPYDVAADADGHAYVAGQTFSQDFPTTPGAFQESTSEVAGFVTKLSADGSSLVWSTYLRAASLRTIAVDAGEDVYVAGYATTADFPTTPGAYDTTYNDNYDDVVAKLDSTGSQLLYGTYLGGSSYEGAEDIDLDDSGAVYIASNSASPDFPTTSDAYDTTHAGAIYSNAAVTKLDPTGSTLEYSTFVGSRSSTYGIAADGDGSAYLTGRTNDPAFPATPGSHDPSFNGVEDGYLSKLSPDGSALSYSTFLGGSDYDAGVGVAIGGNRNAYVLGLTHSSNFPATPAAFDTTYGGNTDLFVLRMNSDGSGLVYSTYLGGGAGDFMDWGKMIAVDAQGAAYVTAETSSSNFPVTADAAQPTLGGSLDALLTKLAPDGSHLLYSSYMGGSNLDNARGLALDGRGNAYITGQTDGDFPTTPGAFKEMGSYDGFVVQFQIGPATLSLTPKTATNILDQGSHCVTATVANADGDAMPGIDVSFTVTGATSASGSQATDASGQTTFCYQGPELPGTDHITAAVEPDGPSDRATKTWVAPPSSEDCKVNAEGRIRAANSDRADFALEAKISGSVKGRARYTDRGPAQPLELNVKSIDALVCEGRDATIFAHRGSVAFRIEVSDRSRNGRQDTFRIVTAQGYDSGTQTLQRGNVTVR
jgi:beta-propeller repeat-containing protein